MATHDEEVTGADDGARIGRDVRLRAIPDLKSVHPSQVYRTTQPFHATIRQAIVANGTIVPRKEVFVKPQISGIVQKILVERGDVVRAGDLVAVIRPLPNPSDINAADGELHNARLNHLHAKQELDRIEGLVKAMRRRRASTRSYGRNCIWPSSDSRLPGVTLKSCKPAPQLPLAAARRRFVPPSAVWCSSDLWRSERL